MSRLRDLLGDARGALDEWANKRNKDGTYNVKFDDGAEGWSGVWRRMFGKNVFIDADGSVLGVPKDLQQSKYTSAEMRIARRLFPKGQHRNSYYKDGIEGMSSAFLELEVELGRQRALGWRRAQYISVVAEIERHPQLQRAFEGRFGAGWRDKAKDASILRGVVEGVSIEAQLRNIRRARLADSLEQYANPRKRFPDDFQERHFTMSGTDLKADIQTLRAAAKRSPEIADRLKRDLGADWNEKLDLVLADRPEKLDYRDDGGKISGKLVRRLRGLKKPSERTLANLIKITGGIDRLRLLASLNRELSNQLDDHFQSAKDYYSNYWEKLAVKPKVLAVLGAVTGLIDPKLSVDLAREVESSGISLADLSTLAEHDPKVRKAIREALGSHWKGRLAYVERELANRSEARKWGRNGRALRERSWQDEATYDQALPSPQFHQIVSSTREEITAELGKTERALDLKMRSLRQALRKVTQKAWEKKGEKPRLAQEVEIRSIQSSSVQESVNSILNSAMKLIHPDLVGPPMEDREHRFNSGVTLGIREFAEGESAIGGAARGYCQSTGGRPEIVLKTADLERGDVVFHELGHYLEHGNGRLADACEHFLKSRYGESEAASLSDWGSDYDSSEVTIPDQFHSPYVGKIYARFRSSEVFSMALQAFAYAHTMAELWEKDPELFALAYAALSGKFGFRE